jgi:uracil-DNA glycosylase
MKSFKRLGIDPLVIYGTLFVKCPVPDTDMSAAGCRARVAEEIAIVQPRLVVVMGELAVDELNALDLPLARPVEPKLGEVQKLTPSLDVLYVPDIDAALDEEGAKRRFWDAFRELGRWYEELPPY